MPAKTLEEKVAERPTDSALAMLAVELSELQMQVEAIATIQKKHIEAKE